MSNYFIASTKEPIGQFYGSLRRQRLGGGAKVLSLRYGKGTDVLRDGYASNKYGGWTGPSCGLNWLKFWNGCGGNMLKFSRFTGKGGIFGGIVDGLGGTLAGAVVLCPLLPPWIACMAAYPPTPVATAPKATPAPSAAGFNWSFLIFDSLSLAALSFAFFFWSEEWDLFEPSLGRFRFFVFWCFHQVKLNCICGFLHKMIDFLFTCRLFSHIFHSAVSVNFWDEGRWRRFIHRQRSSCCKRCRQEHENQTDFSRTRSVGKLYKNSSASMLHFLWCERELDN